MRQIKLSGREIAILRAVGFSEPVEGSAVLEAVNLPAEDVADVLSGLMDVGYVESTPPLETVNEELVATTRFEVNPSYVSQLREAMTKRY